jgi:hypothetical protein
MDEGIKALRKLTDEVVGVASETAQRVTCSGAGIQSAPTSLAGRSASLFGRAPEVHPQHASCAGGSESATSNQAVSAGGGTSPAGGRSVAMRRLGLELPRLQSWGSEGMVDTPRAAQAGSAAASPTAMGDASSLSVISSSIDAFDEDPQSHTLEASTWVTGALKCQKLHAAGCLLSCRWMMS